MAGNTPIVIGKKSQEAIIQFFRQCWQLTGQQWNLREEMRQVDLAYIREMDWTVENQRAKLANTLGDSTRLQNPTVPIVKPAVDAAVDYQASVFLTGNPLFGVVSDAANEDAALQLETIIDNQAIRGAWARELLLFFQDGFKYNLSAVEVDWCTETVASLETDLSFMSGKQAKPKEFLWSGNTLERWDPYNTFFDTRVIPSDIPKKGEFVGCTKLIGRTALKQFMANLPDKMIENVIPAFESGLGTSVGLNGGIESYFIPQINPRALINKNTYASTDWMAWAQLINRNESNNIQYKNIYQLTKLYGRILPSDFGIRTPGANTPQIWKFYLVNNQILIYAERQTNAHGLIPVLFGQPDEDGLSYQTKSRATNVKPIQEITSALMTSVMAARRRAISDRTYYDPSRISEAHINSPNPSAKIPVRPSAYGKGISEAFAQAPFRDENSAQILQMIPAISRFADILNQSNPAKQGQFVKGNKTLREYEDVMSNANSHDQVTGIMYESQIFTPMKMIFKTNILQYQGADALYNREQKQIVKIDPVTLRKAVLQFKVSDGMIPTEKVISADTLKVAFQVLGSSPQINSAYNIGPLFSYLMKVEGGDISEFEKPPEQVAYEQAVAQWQQLVQMAIQQKATPEQLKALPPQPLPQQYNYNPQQQGAPAGTAPQPTTRIENITRNQVPGIAGTY